MPTKNRLSSFSGGPQEGAYNFQREHMKVNYPSNTNDGWITPSRILHQYPLSIPTSMSAFIQRIKGADLCREVIDRLPSILLQSQEPVYETILDLDMKFQNHLKELPVFFRLDAESIQQSQQICKDQPSIAWQRIGIHFSLYTRLGRLHRPYHLEGMTNQKYAYSRTMCVRCAQTVLELRRLMDGAGAQIGLKPARFWTVMQHVFLATLVLATDVSLDPHGQDVEARKAKVLAAYRTLEKSEKESNHLMEGIQKNMQAVLSTLQKQRPQSSNDSQPIEVTNINSSSYAEPNETTTDEQEVRGLDDSPPVSQNPHTGGRLFPVFKSTDLANATEEMDWDQLCSEFLAIAPELNAPQWNLLWGDIVEF